MRMMMVVVTSHTVSDPVRGYLLLHSAAFIKHYWVHSDSWPMCLFDRQSLDNFCLCHIMKFWPRDHTFSEVDLRCCKLKCLQEVLLCQRLCWFELALQRSRSKMINKVISQTPLRGWIKSQGSQLRIELATVKSNLELALVWPMSLQCPSMEQSMAGYRERCSCQLSNIECANQRYPQFNGYPLLTWWVKCGPNFAVLSNSAQYQ